MMSNKSFFVGALLSLGVLTAVGCRQGEADRARDAARQSTARQEAFDERNQTLAMIKREQTDLRDRLQGEVDDIDQKLGESKDGAKTAALAARRSALKADLDALDATRDGEWDALRARIEKDLGKDALERPRVRT